VDLFRTQLNIRLCRDSLPVFAAIVLHWLNMKDLPEQLPAAAAAAAGAAPEPVVMQLTEPLQFAPDEAGAAAAEDAASDAFAFRRRSDSLPPAEPVSSPSIFGTILLYFISLIRG
jgi:hypothetical protein